MRSITDKKVVGSGRIFEALIYRCWTTMNPTFKATSLEAQPPLLRGKFSLFSDLVEPAPGSGQRWVLGCGDWMWTLNTQDLSSMQQAVGAVAKGALLSRVGEFELSSPQPPTQTFTLVRGPIRLFLSAADFPDLVELLQQAGAAYG